MSLPALEFDSPTLKWGIVLQAPARLSSASLETVRVGVSADAGGRPVDMTDGYTADVGFSNDPNAVPAVWTAAEWNVSIIGTYSAGVLVGDGTGAIQLAAGVWYAWIRVTETAPDGEVVVRQAGKIIVD
jgi:hypothetical protein